jgi:hypothetical protein
MYMTRFNPLNEHGRVEIEIHAFLVWTAELKETPPPTTTLFYYWTRETLCSSNSEKFTGHC